ncbi:MAG: hypothetical protein D8M59_06000 [Planctomycetes bacterium]|nr:hypothetical protein [Planctomycetota bacterium]NOG55863.1 hypothetical protein [Planctomycetota bacterium]
MTRHRFCVTCIALAATCLSCASSSIAAVIHVPADYPTIQQAIDAAIDGDEIIVSPGTYNEAINFYGKAVYLHSSDGAEVTTIDARAEDTSAVKCMNGETADTILEGFTITRGKGRFDRGTRHRYGGGLFCWDSGPTVRHCRLTANTAGYGGGIYASEAPTLTLEDCVIERNRTYFSGGAGVYCTDSSTLYMFECSIQYNESNVSGAGLWSTSSTAIIESCTIADNKSSHDSGGGAYFRRSDAFINDTLIAGNVAEYGGGIKLSIGTVDITNCTFRNNLARVSGGAIQIDGIPTSLSVANCVFTYNRADDLGGAVYYYRDSVAETTHCVFYGNSASGGGAAYLRENTSSIRQCVFIDNRAFSGGAIMLEWVSRLTGADITNSVFGRNCALEGGALYCYASDAPVLNCAFVHNVADTSGGAIYQNGNGRRLPVTNSILWKNVPNEIYNYSYGAELTYCDVYGGYGGGGNFEASPMFADAANDDYHLMPASPCIDAGLNAAMRYDVDCDGAPRFFDDNGKPDIGYGTAPIVDIGPYEVQDHSANALTIMPMPLFGWKPLELTGLNVTPNEQFWLLYSIAGSGDTYIKALDVHVNLRNPKLALGPLMSDANGAVTGSRDLIKVSQVTDIWFQGVQQGVATNVVATRVMP